MNRRSRKSILRVKNFVYHINDMIGHGSAGKVYRGINENNGLQVAIKTLQMSQIDNEVTRYLLQCQKEALSSIHSPYVLYAYDIVQNDKQCLIVTPLCDGGTLKQYITSKGKLPQKQALQIFVKILKGYITIRDKGFIHRDLKSHNVMFLNKQPIIIDFGYCQKILGDKPKMFYNVGSPSYMSPQAYFQTIYSDKSDLWALGIVLYEMLQGHTIDQGLHIQRYFDILFKQGITFMSEVSQQTQKIIKAILSQKPKNRPSIQEVLQRIQKTISQSSPKPHQKIHLNKKNLFYNNGKISLKQIEYQTKSTTQHQLIQTIPHQQNVKIHNNIQNFNIPSSLTQRFPNNFLKVQGFDQNFVQLSESLYTPEQQSTQNHVLSDKSFQKQKSPPLYTQQQFRINSHPYSLQTLNQTPLQCNQQQLIQQPPLYLNPQKYAKKPPQSTYHLSSNTTVVQNSFQYLSYGETLTPQNIPHIYTQPKLKVSDNVIYSNNKQNTTINDVKCIYTTIDRKTNATSEHDSYHGNAFIDIKLQNSINNNRITMDSIKNNSGQIHQINILSPTSPQHLQIPKQSKHNNQHFLVDKVRANSRSFNQQVHSYPFLQNPFKNGNQISNSIMKSMTQEQIHHNRYFNHNSHIPKQITPHFQINGNHLRTNFNQNAPFLLIGDSKIAQKNTYSFRQNTSRPFSPVASQRSSMPTNQYNSNGLLMVKGNSQIIPKISLKKAQPYFNMNAICHGNKNNLKVISAIHKPFKQALSSSKQINQIKQVHAIHNLQPLCRTRANSNNSPVPQQLFMVTLLNHRVAPTST